MRYQIVDATGSWWNVSADKDEQATLFDSISEARDCIPELAQCLECSPDDLRVIERPDLTPAA